MNSGYAPGDGRESAIIADLAPGNYTAIVRGVNNTTGVGLVEVYDLSADANSILGNISTRAFVQTGDNVMIGGFIVQGMQPKRVIIRAIGPELGAPPYDVPNALANPTLELHDSTGALIASNDNWATTIIGGIITDQPSARHPSQRLRSGRRKGVGNHRRSASGQLHRDRAWRKQYDRSCFGRSVRSALILLSKAFALINEPESLRAI